MSISFSPYFSLSLSTVDAHLDVRPLKLGKVHSGSPFRQMLEDLRFIHSGKFIEFGAQGAFIYLFKYIIRYLNYFPHISEIFMYIYMLSKAPAVVKNMQITYLRKEVELSGLVG